MSPYWYQSILIVLLTASLAVTDDRTPPSPALDPQRFDLSSLVDRTDLSFADGDDYYGILDYARQVDSQALRELAARRHHQRWENSSQFHRQPEQNFPLFYDLTQHPEVYRGQPVTMRGHLVRLVKYDAAPNESGIETLYEGWLVTPDSQTHPATIICTEIPPGMPIGEELIDGVSVTGYFFKLHTYSSRDNKTRFAPLLLAHRLNWSPTAVSAPGWSVSQWGMFAGIALLAAGGMIMAIVSLRRRQSARHSRFAETLPQTPPDFLNDLNP